MVSSELQLLYQATVIVLKLDKQAPGMTPKLHIFGDGLSWTGVLDHGCIDIGCHMGLLKQGCKNNETMLSLLELKQDWNTDELRLKRG